MVRQSSGIFTLVDGRRRGASDSAAYLAFDLPKRALLSQALATDTSIYFAGLVEPRKIKFLPVWMSRPHGAKNLTERQGLSISRLEVW